MCVYTELNKLRLFIECINSHYSDLFDTFADCHVHAILVSETWLEPHLPSILSWIHPGFVTPGFPHDRADYTGGGVFIYIVLLLIKFCFLLLLIILLPLRICFSRFQSVGLKLLLQLFIVLLSTTSPISIRVWNLYGLNMHTILSWPILPHQFPSFQILMLL